MCYYKIDFPLKNIKMKSVYYKEPEILYIIEIYKKTETQAFSILLKHKKSGNIN